MHQTTHVLIGPLRHAGTQVLSNLLQQELMLLDRLSGLVLTLGDPGITGKMNGWSFRWGTTFDAPL